MSKIFIIGSDENLMSIYLVFLILLLLTVFLSGVLIFKRYKKESGIYFLILSIAIILWYILYFLGFNSDYGEEVILRIYRFQYSLSIVGFYSLLCFILFFGIPKERVKKYGYFIYLFFGIIFFIANFTSLLVQKLEYSPTAYYVEVFGYLYLFFIFLYVLILPLFLIISYYKLKLLSYLDRTRIFYIIIGFLFYVGISLVFIVFIPFLLSDSAALLHEEYIPFFILPFLFSVLYSSYKYDFSDAKIYLNSIFIYSCSLILSFGWLFVIHFLIGYLGEGFHSFWNIDKDLGWFDIVLGIMLFSFFLRIFQRFKISNELNLKLRILQDSLPFITNNESLNDFLGEKFRKELHITGVRLREIFDNKDDIVRFFLKNRDIKYIVNDIVFFENHKHKFENGLLSISPKDVLIFPVFKTEDEIISLLFIERKIIRDSYTKQEIQEFYNFSLFLRGYYKYISVYKKSQDLSVTLDRRVDEKTMEFNNLLNKQKEFIAYVGHEIKNPITSTLFLSDSLKQDVLGKVSKDVDEDAAILYDELVKVSKLVKYIFSAEKFDLDKVKLYKNKINISNFLGSELQSFRNNYSFVHFLSDIENDIYSEIDETQFRQVIQNLVNNSIKFINNTNPQIYVRLYIIEDQICIDIEDNGKGLSQSEAKEIFSKYITGSGSSTGLGMGLYLCKKIIELHEGSITVEPSKKLGGACFSIKF